MKDIDEDKNNFEVNNEDVNTSSDNLDVDFEAIGDDDVGADIAVNSLDYSENKTNEDKEDLQSLVSMLMSNNYLDEEKTSRNLSEELPKALGVEFNSTDDLLSKNPENEENVLVEINRTKETEANHNSENEDYNKNLSNLKHLSQKNL